jgi:enoyl-[acyl-carrier protein] reductase II
MLHTPLCDLLGIELPIVQAAIWPATSPALVAAVSNAGGLGSIGAVFESAASLRQQVARVRTLTDRPFAVNHVVPLLNEEAFAFTLETKPAVVSFALGDPGDLVRRAQDAGARVIHQVHTVGQAREAVMRGIDAIIAQGGEAGGQGMEHGPSTMVLTPQVVDAVSPVPVLAAGGVADGRGLAAALVLGAQGANIGTRFLASTEAGVPAAWKEAILRGESEDAVRFATWKAIMPPAGAGAYEVVPRVLSTSFIETWQDRPEDAAEQAERLRGEIFGALQEGRAHELVPFTGQTVGLVDEILPAAEIIRLMVAEAKQALSGSRHGES